MFLSALVGFWYELSLPAEDPNYRDVKNETADEKQEIMVCI